MKLLKRILIWAGIGLLSLILLCITALGLFLCWMKWSGDRDWKRVQAELHTKGEKLTLEELLPPPPPDSQNFYSDPMWQELTNKQIPKDKQLINRWKTPLSESEREQLKSLLGRDASNREDALNDLWAKYCNDGKGEDRRKLSPLALELAMPAAPLLSQLAELSKRPSANFPIHYEDNIHTALPHISPLISMGLLLGTKASAEIELGDATASSQDILLLFRLSSTLQTEPILLPLLVREVLSDSAMKSLNRGITSHLWNEAELIAFQQQLVQIRFQKDLPDVLRGERACMDLASLINLPETMSLREKSGLIAKSEQFIFQDSQKAYYDEYIQQLIESLLHSDKGGLNVRTVYVDESIEQSLREAEPKDLHELRGVYRSIIVRMNSDIIKKSVQRAVEAQTQLSQTLIACALERYRLAHGSYPGALDALIPEYLSSIPKEPTTGRPMQYRLLPDGSFLLWAPGWKLMTLNGKPGQYNGEGDIVWNKPISRGSRN